MIFFKRRKAENPDPLANPAFRKPGILESIGEALLGLNRPLLCAQVEVSSACMGKCTYCPHSSQAASWRTRHISAEIFSRLWPLFKLCQQVHLQGWGEPFLHPRFFDLANLAKKAGCHVSTTSCGLLMNENMAQKTLAAGLDLIAFSLAGTDQPSNQSRLNVDFDKVCANIKLLQKMREQMKSPLEIHLAYILLADRIDALVNLPELMADLGVDTAIVSTLDYLASPEDREKAFLPEDVEKIERARIILRHVSAEAEALGKKIHYALPGTKARIHENGCRENTRKTLYIDADGNVSPCVYLNVPGSDSNDKRRIFGNVLEENPLDIWKKAEFGAFRQALIEGKPDGVCLKCPKRLEIVEE